MNGDRIQRAAVAKSGLIYPQYRLGQPLQVVSSEGSYLNLADGRRVLDCECGSGVFSLGHRHPGVSKAFTQALESWDIGNHHLISEPKGLLAARLAGLLPGDLRCTVFNVTSSEAVDVAVKLARGATGKPLILSADNAFHGVTGFSLAASAVSLSDSLGFEAPGFVHVLFGDIPSLKGALEAHTGKVAALLIEPVAVAAGAVPLPEGYLAQARHLCDRHDALLIVDESCTGLGRTGHLFAVNRENIIPDIMVVGRALGGGLYPIHATCHREFLDAFYQANPFIHISTFGGSEVGCFCAMTALDALSDPDLVRNVRRHAALLRETLERLAGDCNEIGGVHVTGLLAGLDLERVETARQVQNALRKMGLHCRPASLCPSTLLLIPPLTILPEEITELLGMLLEIPQILRGEAP